MSVDKLNTNTLVQNLQNQGLICKEIQVDLSLSQRIGRFVIALLATSFFFIGLCFKPIRDYWVEAWTGKETVIQTYRPKIEPLAEVVVEPTKKPTNKPVKHVRFNLPEETNQKDSAVNGFKNIIKNGWPAAKYSLLFTAITYIYSDLIKFPAPYNLISLPLATCYYKIYNSAFNSLSDVQVNGMIGGLCISIVPILLQTVSLSSQTAHLLYGTPILLSNVFTVSTVAASVLLGTAASFLIGSRN